MTTLTRQQALDIFNSRAATRHYAPSKKISEEDFHAILEFARLSPSSVGAEPWQFLVIQNPQLREKIKPVAWGIKHPMNEMSHLVVILAKKNARYDSDFMRQSLERRNLNQAQIEKSLNVYQTFQTEHIKILDNERTLFDWASKQTYIALANMMTGAALLGIDSCPIEGFIYDEVNRILSEEGLVDLNEYGVSVMVTFGYRSQEPRPKMRKPQSEVVRWIE
ncbi:nitroreductase [Nicoletella semolina]|uniref:Nitroreductase n=1 Tax=Nicoletella semolina TaxID=271160 RepID=A0A4R2NBW5_9PAST|nr:NAD(P)H-dependent oxidoreductase [Nicoletella semolina]MDH2924989.1 NAD(P)H-dependent oxidoreductase [Nicoletella semolina]TCP18538.1 nitroreductase [Nicoletella semolina]